jgi:pimeloyl-ACP methyl ester carboxylesterase
MRTSRAVARSIIVAIMTAFAISILGITQSLTTAFVLTAALPITQALIVPGTGTPHAANDYLDNAVNYYVVHGTVTPPCDVTTSSAGCPTTQGIDYFATFWPIPLPGWGGLQGQKWNVSVQSGVDGLNAKYAPFMDPANTDNVMIFGYSQGATVASNFKREHATDDPSVKARTDYFFIGNPQRPSGGFFERFAFLGNVPILDAQFGDPSPTDTCTDAAGELRTCATDFALQYDGVVDFPQWLLNPLALANAVAGFQYVHGTYLAPNGDDAVTDTPYGYTPQEVEDAVTAAQANCDATTYCQQVPGSDTIYITLPAKYIPLFQPVVDLANATGTAPVIVPITDFLSPFTRTLIETGYDRSDYSNPQPASLLPPKTFNPIQTAAELVSDIPVGINMALTPGQTPLPPPAGQGPQTLSTLSETNTSNAAVVANTTTQAPKLGLIRDSLFAKPNAGILATGSGGTGADHPLQNALKDVHPVRDVVKAVSGAVNKALGKDDSKASDSGN